ncbi:MAG: type I 3-dehydroquinate dehydratase [Candidatus Omnitrophica bacterium]|nr:type I 3-dehydroquinate dehydratase [Candidatus Omnitrophota bacterium]
MVKIGTLVLDGSPRVAVSVRDGVFAQFLRAEKKYGLDVVELRIDLFSCLDEQYVITEIKKYAAFPILATIRSAREGGGWKKSEKKRLHLFNVVIPHVHAVDIELSSPIAKEVAQRARRAGKTVLVSHHNFMHTPAKPALEKILKQAKSIRADIVKIAAEAHNLNDVRTLADFLLTHRQENLVVIAMGKEGVVSRILFPALGSFLTYAGLEDGLAPGQLNLAQTSEWLKKLYPNKK